MNQKLVIEERKLKSGDELFTVLLGGIHRRSRYSKCVT